MTHNILDYLNESIQLELNVANLYQLFYDLYTEDRNFWYSMIIEEKNHAALLKSGLDFIKTNNFPKEILSDDLEILKESNKKILNILEDFRINPSRLLSFKIAIEIERTIGETHFNKIMTTDTDSYLINIFKELNKEDVNHEDKIIKYMIKKSV